MERAAVLIGVNRTGGLACAAGLCRQSGRRALAGDRSPFTLSGALGSPLVRRSATKTDVDGHTPNRDGFDGYLDEPVVARWIHDALTAS
jgi:hypothetical protein